MAGRTFQSLFGASGEPLGEDAELLSERIQRAKQTQEETEDEKEEREDGEEEAEEEAEEVWDDDFPADAEMESNNGRPKLPAAISAESRRSIADWADHDDDEDNWKEALQARVDQLELVVGKTSDAAMASNTGNNGSSSGSIGSVEGATVAMPGTPVDQRATLTLLPKTNLSRAVSAPPAPEEHKPLSKLKTPSMVRSTTMATGAGGAKAAASGAAVVAGGDQTTARKRSNSRDFSARLGTLASEQKRLTKAAAAATSSPSNSVFVRAVVARGASATSRSHTEPKKSDEGHAEKRAKSSDRRSSILALNDAEVVRRFILDDVKKISVERIVADAKRLHFLEDVYRRQQSQAPPVASASGSGARHSSPTKKHLV